MMKGTQLHKECCQFDSIVPFCKYQYSSTGSLFFIVFNHLSKKIYNKENLFYSTF